MTVSLEDFSIEWLGYATVRLETAAGRVLYTDPGRYGVLDGYEERDGDLVLVTHDHHYDPDGIDRVAGPDATVVVFEAVAADRIDRDVRAVGDLEHAVRRIETDEVLTVDGIDVTATPAYNHRDGDDRVSHPPGFGCGYLMAVDGHTIVWPGDTDLLAAFRSLDASILLANIGGSVVMDRHEAVTLATWLEPDLVIPIHYNTIDLLEADSRAFAVDVAERSIPVALDEPMES